MAAREIAIERQHPQVMMHESLGLGSLNYLSARRAYCWLTRSERLNTSTLALKAAHAEFAEPFMSAGCLPTCMKVRFWPTAALATVRSRPAADGQIRLES
jgi:hypothetical protein